MWLDVFKAMLGEVSVFEDLFEDSVYRDVAKLLLVIYLLVVAVMLLNLLIAVLRCVNLGASVCRFLSVGLTYLRYVLQSLTRSCRSWRSHFNPNST